MNIRHRREEPPEVNLTPLIDVVLLLIIFFILATTFDKNSELAIELPEASVEPVQPNDEQAIEVAIDVEGRFYIDGRRLVNTQPATLRQALAAAAAGRPAPPIILSADAKTPHQAVIAVMDASQKLGFVKLTFATRFAQEQDGETR